MQKRRIKGDRSFRKLLRRMPDAMRDEMLVQMDAMGDELLLAMHADVPRQTGALAAGLSKKLLRGSMKLRVGLIGKPINRRLYYGRIVEFGRKAQTVTVRRRGRLGNVTSYQMRVSALPARRFVYTRRNALKESFTRRINTFWNRMLARAAQGVTDD